MEFLAIVDPVTLEPRAVYQRTASGSTVGAFAIGTGRAQFSERAAQFGEVGIGGFPGGDAIEDGFLAFESDDSAGPTELLDALAKEWEHGATCLAERFAFKPIFGSLELTENVTVAREVFVHHLAARVLHAARFFGTPFAIDSKLSAITPMFVDATDDALCVVVAPFEKQRDADLALAYGLAYAGDRELIAVIPEQLAGPTLRRAAFLETALRVVTYSARTVLGRWSFRATEVVIPARVEVLAMYTDKLVTEEHDLADRAAWVAPLRKWADIHVHLQTAHRKSYLAWHCNGRLVLRLQRTRGGIHVFGGVKASEKAKLFPPVNKQLLTSQHSEEQFKSLTQSIDEAIERRLAGVDSGHAEHLLQALLSNRPTALGLVKDKTLMRREFPAIRADGSRGYIDFLGVDANGRIHIIETKIGNDAMLVLQALDYWIWANAHAPELAMFFGLKTESPEIVIDFVVGSKGTGAPIGPYTAAQAETLSGAVAWRCYVASNWDKHALELQTYGSRKWPAAPRFGATRYAHTLHTHLASPDHAPGQLIGGALLTDPELGVVPAAQWALEQLTTQGLLHKYVHHVRSSQAFALNLFGPLTPHDVRTLLNLWFDDVIDAEPPTFEWIDPDDRLAESTPKRPHHTQVDVVLRGTTSNGEAVAALIEVKLSEQDFGNCSAFQADKNDQRAICTHDGPFGNDIASCFQLRNHNGPHRRRYDEHLPPFLAAPPTAGCWFRGGLNQPMRNVALLQTMLDTGAIGDAAYVLCAPGENLTVQRTWKQAQALFGPRLHYLDPNDVVALHEHPKTQTLIARYKLRQVLEHVAELDVAEPDWPTKAVRELWSWRVVAELLRRHPGRFDIIETHPGGGQYDCLSLYESADVSAERHIDLNREGSLHISSEAEGYPGPIANIWHDLDTGTITVDDVADFIDRWSPAPSTKAASNDATSADLTFEVIAAVNEQLDPELSVTWRNGMRDSSGGDAGMHSNWFRDFPTAAAQLADDQRGNDFGSVAYRFWFLITDDKPILCLDTSACVHTKNGEVIELSSFGPNANEIAVAMSFD